MEKYWKSIEEKEVNQNNIQKSGEFSFLKGDHESLKATRRDFLKLFGFSMGVATVASSCEQPVKKAIPYLIKPENITPGKASYFASSFFEENQYCSILVKTRDGRPIKIEGNELSPVSKGGTSARVQASVLSVYDTHRFKSPMIDDKAVTWEEMDKKIIEELNKVKAENKKTIILTGTIISPSTKAVLRKFKQKHSNAEIVTYDAVSASGIIEANQKSFGIAAIPNYHFDKAESIVGFSADFLGTWIEPVSFAKGYSKTRELTDGQKKISKHYHFESGMSLTGSNADKRIIIKPSEEKLILANLYNSLADKLGAEQFNIPSCHYDLSEVVKSLTKSKGKSIVVSGSNDTNTQLIVNAINQLLGNIGKTIDLSHPILVKQGMDKDLIQLKKDIEKDKVGGLIFYNTNPVYNINGFDQLIEKVGLTISLSSKPNETTKSSKYICPDHTYLESWNDYEPIPGQYSLAQPVIQPLFKTRQAQETMLIWAGDDTKYYDFIRTEWRIEIFPNNKTNLSFNNFWNKSLQDGCTTITKKSNSVSYNTQASNKALSNIKEEPEKGIELSVYEKIAIGSGELANIPWLQEMPDPVSKATWDNYLTISPKYAKEHSLKTGDVVKINGNTKVPVYIQPGQAYGTVSLALGYGRDNAGIIADTFGVNAFPLVDFNGNNRKYAIEGISIEKTGEFYQLAITQTHHSMEGRALIREASIEEYIDNPAAGNEMHKKVEKHHVSLYKKREFPGHHWGMAIDLNKCTGCSACVIACQVENNIPVVGKKQVSRVHEMHWIRIDRYYNGNEDDPETVRQPVMCQHCDNAPCENVCPVAATNNSSEGLNQMAYNRCIGTRYCNNNCPYKVRRFNYFDYTGADAIKGNEYDVTGMTLDLPRMVLNPDVTIRAKGVIEKCSFCVQRIQEKKLQAKLENRELSDGEIKPACAQACPSEAIVFGDMNNPDSKVSKFFKDERNYHLLEEIHTLPSVGYLTKIKNKKAKSKAQVEEQGHHGA